MGTPVYRTSGRTCTLSTQVFSVFHGPTCPAVHLYTRQALKGHLEAIGDLSQNMGNAEDHDGHHLTMMLRGKLQFGTLEADRYTLPESRAR